ncbi:MAG TPA: hypothetical protein VGU71_07200 [Candidatus Dormibacteraeota bacterium]|nr:hypothetical protein [Candidatus Dormibacteraeota bacterium]
MASSSAIRKGLALAVLPIVLAACGNTPSGTTAPPAARPSASSNPFPSPTPGGPAPPPRATVTCASKIPSRAQLALVTLRGGSGIAVRDITDVGHPVNRCSISGGNYLRFVNVTHISYIAMASSDLGAPGALYLVDLQTQTTSLVRAWASGGYLSWVYAWSPDGQALSYLTSDSTGVFWHLLSASGDRTLSSLGPVSGRGGTPDDDAMVGFSADGQYVALEETFTLGNKTTVTGLPLQVVRVADGKVVYSRTDATMAAWSAGAGQRFYFRTATGVQSWEPSGQIRTLAVGLSWIHPWPSADGSHIAYSTLDTQGNHKVAVIDVAGGTPNQLSAEPRVAASFITPALVWYAGESVCTATGPCGLGGPPLTGVTYISDLAGVETESIDAAFYDSWPHVAGQ